MTKLRDCQDLLIDEIIFLENLSFNDFFNQKKLLLLHLKNINTKLTGILSPVTVFTVEKTDQSLVLLNRLCEEYRAILPETNMSVGLKSVLTKTQEICDLIQIALKNIPPKMEEVPRARL